MKNLYNTSFTKFRWFVKRFGWSQLIMKPLRTVFAPIIIRMRRQLYFEYNGKVVPVLYARHSVTWSNERCVEVPLVMSMLEGCDKTSVLEVGNVLKNFYSLPHIVVDKFAKGHSVLNEDILTLDIPPCYDFVVSISTLEHVRFDDDALDTTYDSFLQAVDRCKRMVAPGGKFIFTVPLGYNPAVDEAIRQNKLPEFDCTFFVRRTFAFWWPLRDASCVMGVANGNTLLNGYEYGRPYPYANAFMVAVYTKPENVK